MPDILSTLMPLVALVAIFYFLMIRPQQRKMREQQQRISSLSEGTRIMTTAGVYGTVRHLGQQQAVIEIAPGVEMTIIKAAIAKIVPESEDEFEYEGDEDGAEIDDDFDQAIAGFDSPSAPDPQADEGTPEEPRPGESR